MTCLTISRTRATRPHQLPVGGKRSARQLQTRAPEAADWHWLEQQSLPVRQVAPAAPQLVPPPPPLDVLPEQTLSLLNVRQNPEQQSPPSVHVAPSFPQAPPSPLASVDGGGAQTEVEPETAMQ